MYIIVVGGGTVGKYLSKALLAENHEVVLLEENRAAAAALADDLGESVALEGDGAEVATLERIGAHRGDVLVAVTGDDHVNLVCCEVAKARFQVPRVIARVNNPQNQKLFALLGIDATVSVTSVILSIIEQEIPHHAMINLLSLKQAGMEVVEVEVPPSSPVVGKRLRDIGLERDMNVSVILRGQEAITPSAETEVRPGDKLFALIRDTKEDEFRSLLVGDAVGI
ncbi:MAG: TrkA family potassium uptake protein [Chloroflexi bacterium]|nr:TrkA family potassium uptake protein [Chloroflexota bacterium]